VINKFGNAFPPSLPPSLPPYRHPLQLRLQSFLALLQPFDAGLALSNICLGGEGGREGGREGGGI